MPRTEHNFTLRVVVDGDFECDVEQAIVTRLEGETIASELSHDEAGPVELTVVIDSAEVTSSYNTKVLK